MAINKNANPRVIQPGSGQPSSPSSSSGPSWPIRIVTREEVEALPEIHRLRAEHYIEIGKWAFSDTVKNDKSGGEGL